MNKSTGTQTGGHDSPSDAVLSTVVQGVASGPEESAISFIYQKIPEVPEFQVLRQELRQFLDPTNVKDSGDEFINSSISLQRNGISFLKGSSSPKVTALHNLAWSLNRRYRRLSNLEDLDEAISCLAEAAMLAPEDDEVRPTLFTDLASLHYDMYHCTGLPGSLDQALQFFHMAVSLLSEDHPGRVNPVLGQSRCHLARFQILGQLSDLESVISLLPETVLLVPEYDPLYPDIMNTLGSAYSFRYSLLNQPEDIDMALGCKTQATQRHSGDAFEREMWLSDLAGLYFTRFEHLGEMEDSQHAINWQRAAIALVSDNDSEKAILFGQLGDIYNLRYEQSKNLEDIDQAIECLEQVISLTSESDPKRLRAFQTLASMYNRRSTRSRSSEDLTKSIDRLLQVVSLLPDVHPDRAPTYSHLADLHHSRYSLTKELADLDKEIEYLTIALGLVPAPHPMRPQLLANLANSQELRYKSTGKQEDAESSIACYRQIAQTMTADSYVRFSAASSWAKIESLLGSNSLDVYETIVNMLPQVFWLGSGDMKCYDSGLNIEHITTGVVAAAIAAQSYGTALQWFDRCRSRAWKETLELRGATLTQLHSANPELATNLERTAHELNVAQGSADERTAAVRNRLANQWESLVSSIRLLPGLEGFLMPKELPELLRAARFGDVVLVNVHESRSDALVMRSGQGAVQHVPLPKLTMQKVMLARLEFKAILGNLGSPVDQSGESKFEGILGMLWDDVARPVLDSLGYISQEIPRDKLPHVTWCLTGPLSSLPLHAAGCYKEPKAGIFDYAITSYAPNLSALLADPPSLDSIKDILVVDRIKGDTRGEMLKRLAEDTDRSSGLHVTELLGEAAMADAVLEHCSKHDWIHLGCPVSENSAHPMASMLHLHGGDLSLAELLSPPRNGGGVVLLSRGAAAQTDIKVLESFPIATGMIMGGFSTVLTMIWAAEDRDVTKVTDDIYGRLIEKAGDDSECLADALHHAVERLRTEVGERAFMRWLPFVHIGL